VQRRAGSFEPRGLTTERFSDIETNKTLPFVSASGAGQPSMQGWSQLPRRPGPHCRPVVSLRHRALILQVVKDLPDGYRVFDRGNDLDCAPTRLARLNVNIDQFAWSEA
jgi:hypothetical protein